MRVKARSTKGGTRAVAAAVAVGLVALAGLAVAQRPGRTLHQELPASDVPPSPLIGAAGINTNPAAFQSGDKLLTEPALDAAGKRGEPVLGKGGFAADRQTAMTPDANTGTDSTLHYASVFNPDVLPFKRMSAFDGADDSFRLVVARGAPADVPVGGATDKTRDRFWGSMLLELAPGKAVPLPSVAPDMRILSYEVQPKVALEFSKDGADNFFVRSTGGAPGSYRLVFLADADAGYFAPALPAGRRYTARDVAAAAPPELRVALPAAVRREAEVTLRDRLGVDRDMELGVVFNRLVGYFRAFEPKPLPAAPGGDANIYRALTDSQAGVCRHRAFAFAITANAIGLPTRYVENEAHAFVEVWFPERGWQRIDLGGAALRMEVTGADDKTLHRPRAEDPFEKPAQYRNNYTQLEGDIAGLTQQQIDDKRKPVGDDAPASGQFDAAAGAGSGAGPGPDRITPDPGLPAVTPNPKLPTPMLEVLRADATAYRGGEMRVEGRVHVGGKGLPDHHVEIFVARVGAGGAGAKPVQSVVSGPDGTFRADVKLPADLDLATYEIYLSSPPYPDFNAALSD